MTIIVQVGEQGCPAPVRARHAGKLRDLAEGAVPVVALQGVHHVLEEIAAADQRPELVGSHPAHVHLAAHVVVRRHVQHHDVRKAVIVLVGHITTHAEVAHMAGPALQFLAEGAVTTGHVHQVGHVEVVGHVDVLSSVPVQVGRADTQPEGIVLYAGLVGDVREVPAIIAVQAVRRGFAPHHGVQHTEVAFTTDPVRRMHEQVHVQVPIVVHVQEGGLGGMAGVGQPELLRRLAELPIALVQVEQVACSPRVLGRTAPAHMDVEQAVAVHVGHGHAGGPAWWGCVQRGSGHILEPHAAQVPVQPVRHLIAAQVDVGEPVTVQVAECHTTAVVGIDVGEVVHFRALRDGVREVDAGMGCGHLRE